MNLPAKISRLAPETLEELLQAFRRYGQPRLSFLTDSWHCSVEMHVAAKGSIFKVASDFSGHDSPMSAARECWSRMAAALIQLTTP
jgi:hypothetical protein